MMKKLVVIALGLVAFTSAQVRAQQVYPPGTFSIDGIPVACGAFPTVLAYQLPDVGMFNGQAIFLNPAVVGSLPTPLKLYWYAHECAHANGIVNESDADCWAIALGRDQGWFPPQAFQSLMWMFQNNPGSVRHPPGPARVNRMMMCYQN